MGDTRYMRHTKKILASLSLSVPLLFGGFVAVSWLAVTPMSSLAQDAHPELPPGPGRDVLLTTCTKCHTTQNIISQRRDQDGWTATITKMVGYGATGSDEDLTAILDYLTKNFGPDSGAAPAAAAPTTPAATTTPAASTPPAKVDVNKETAAQLKTDLSLTEDDPE